MNKKYYAMCTVVQNSDGEKFLSDLSDMIQDIQNRGLYAEV